MEKQKQRFERASGIVMPIFSLPSPYGIGTLGKEAYEFVDFLSKSGQKYWQILPVGHTGYGDSPYQVYSSVAGNPYFIDLDMLVNIGLLNKENLVDLQSNCEKVDYDNLKEIRLKILYEAYQNSRSNLTIISEIEHFKESNQDWLQDYALFMSLKNYFDQKPLWEWEKEIKRRNPDSIKKYQNLLKEDIEFFIFMQYVFFIQWRELKCYANEKGIKIIGDIPIYPSADSCDVWVDPQLFKVDEDLKATKVAGVPPDYYSKTGQLWGNPVYNWKVHEEEKFSWWIWRVSHTLEFADVLRFDHFRGFQDYWEVPAEEKTAINGKWVPGPRMKLFNALKQEIGDISIIAENLGIIDESVEKFLEETGYPGMGVMIFGLYEKDDNIHLPHNWKRNSVGYTSTHDSETFCQEVLEHLGEGDKKFALDYVNANEKETLGFSAIRSAFASPANLVMVMMQDILSLGSEGRVNTPSTVGGNWVWRAKKEDFSEEISEKLYRLSTIYKRNK